MLSLAVFCALLFGWAFGGRLRRFEAAGLRMLLLPVFALLLQRLFYRPWTLVLSYAIIFVFLFFNRHLKKTVFFFGTGSLCNLLVIAANGWRMPVSVRALEVLSSTGQADLLAGNIPMYAVADAGTRLLFLGDIFYWPVPYIGGFASVGDILLCVGVFFCLMAAMSPTRLPRRVCSG